MRLIIILVIAFFALFAVGCTDDGRIHELEAQNAELQQRVEELESGIETLYRDLEDVSISVNDVEGAAGEMEATIARFDYDDWRDIVPAAILDSSEISTELDEVKSEIETLEAHLRNLR